MSKPILTSTRGRSIGQQSAQRLRELLMLQ
jgi:hypothetical protein